ncbi:MAG: FAD-dependent monooxygenase [Firmicutes bacterium]|nr:FAD-dependent monooxygenase [Bacillota bacterium]
MHSGSGQRVIIVGAGPAGVFTALRLAATGGFQVTIMDKGRDLSHRSCPSIERNAGCVNCPTCSVISGWGGAGAFSDGKLTLSPEIGGHLGEYVGQEKLAGLLEEADRIYLQFGAPPRVYGEVTPEVEELIRKARMADLTMIPTRIRHLGTGYSKQVLAAMESHLRQLGVDIRMGVEVESILSRPAEGHGGSGPAKDAGQVPAEEVWGVRTAKGEEVPADYVVVAPGREGAEWLRGEAERLKIPLATNPVDIGVRVETAAEVLEHITSKVYEAKLIFYSKTFEDKVRTFCMCPHGEVVTENLDGLITVNGHSHAEIKTENTNFALLVSKTFTQPFKDPITYGKHIAGLANLLGGGVLVQRLGDLLTGHRSTEERIHKGTIRPTLHDATPGDLSLVLPYRYLQALVEMLQALDRIAPGIYSRNTLLYGVEVKFYSSRLQLSAELETPVRNLFATGDGAGVTRGLMQASASGLVVAEAIRKRAALALLPAACGHSRDRQ